MHSIPAKISENVNKNDFLGVSASVRRRTGVKFGAENGMVVGSTWVHGLKAEFCMLVHLEVGDGEMVAIEAAEGLAEHRPAQVGRLGRVLGDFVQELPQHGQCVPLSSSFGRASLFCRNFARKCCPSMCCKASTAYQAYLKRASGAHRVPI
tara:strand:- start:172 stop:624 length:453 start_codon:yes stop_codon:yes gene_type:complete